MIHARDIINKGNSGYTLSSLCDSPNLGTLRVKYSPSSGFFFGWGEELVLVGSTAKKGKQRQESDFGEQLNLLLHLLCPACSPLLVLPSGSSGRGSPFFRKFSSSVRRSLPGQAQTRTSKLFRPSRFPLPRIRRGKHRTVEKLDLF